VKPQSDTRPGHVPAEGDLPAYTVRLSERAKRVRLTITPRDGLVVTVPRTMRGFDPSDILIEHGTWIAQAQARFAERRAALLAGPDAVLPGDVAFPATGERWGVEYRASQAATAQAEVRDGLLVVRGPADDGEACQAALQRWLHRAARDRLLPLLAEEAARTGLHYRTASVRGQRSRWAGCSSSGAITLNRCLLFLSPELVRAVMLHELAHLVHVNHSAAYWAELERLDPRVALHRAGMARAWDAVPPWAEP